MQRTIARLGGLAAASALLIVVSGACGLPQPSSSDAAFGDLGVSNGTALAVTLIVNGAAVATVEPGAGATVPKRSLPPMPWTVEARSPTGRVLVSFVARAEDISRTEIPGGVTRLTGAGGRADLSCGRLDVWVGPPMSGPIPGPGVPGDCAP
jgi:hypothetical protein